MAIGFGYMLVSILVLVLVLVLWLVLAFESAFVCALVLALVRREVHRNRASLRNVLNEEKSGNQVSFSFDRVRL